MQVSRKVLDAVSLYMQWREATITANMLEDQLTVRTPYLSRSEQQSYEHIVGLYELEHSPPPKQPVDATTATATAILGE